MADLRHPAHADIMQLIHGTNVFSGYRPSFSEDSSGWNSQHASFDEVIAAVRPEVVIDVGV